MYTSTSKDEKIKKAAEKAVPFILKMMEGGIIPWHKPWAVSIKRPVMVPIPINIPNNGAYSQATGQPYSWGNQMILAAASEGKDWRGAWCTFNYARKNGGYIKAKEKATTIIVPKQNVYEVKDPVTKEPIIDPKTGKPQIKIWYSWDTCDLFHVKRQTVGVKEAPPATIKGVTYVPGENPTPATANWTADEKAETLLGEYLKREGIHRYNGGDRAFYRFIDDSITLPEASAFVEGAEFYSTSFHEVVHSTGTKKRTNRHAEDHGMFGTPGYAREELTAEMGSAILCTMLGIATEKSVTNSAAYLQSWAKAITDDPELFVKAGAKAEAAVNYILCGPATPSK